MADALSSLRENSTPDPSRVSIVISNYNYERYVAAAIESALAQTHRNCEIIVVDDGSTDNSRATIARYGDDPRVRIILQDNGGQAAAMNVGFAASTGDIVIFLDSDDRLKAGAVETVLAHWRPGLSHCQFPLEVIDADDKSLGLHPFSQQIEAGDMFWKLLVGGYYRFMPTSGNAFARDALVWIMPIPADEWRLCADTYIVTMSTAHGHVHSIAEPLGFYRIHNSNGWYREVFDRDRISVIWRQQFQVWRALARLLDQRVVADASPALPRIDADYGALHVYRRLLTGYLNEPDVVSGKQVRVVRRAAVWRAIRAVIPIGHRLLYVGCFVALGVPGRRLPVAARWNAHSTLRPRWLRWLVRRLKGTSFDEWMGRRPKPAQIVPFVLDEYLEFGRGRSAEPYLWYGWDTSEAWINWAYGRMAALVGQVPVDCREIDIEVTLFPFLGGVLKSQELVVRANSTQVFRQNIAREGTIRFSVSRDTVRRQDPLELRFDFPDSVVPKYVDKSAGDYRQLGFAFRRLRISQRQRAMEAARGAYLPLGHRVTAEHAEILNHLGTGWLDPIGGSVRMGERSAVLHMSVLGGAAFDHLARLEFELEDVDVAQRSNVVIEFKGKSVTCIDTMTTSEAVILVPRGTIRPTGGLTLRLLADNLFPESHRRSGGRLCASGPALRAFSLQRLPRLPRRPVFVSGFVLDFRADGSGKAFKARGWHAGEAQGSYSCDVDGRLEGLFLDADRDVFLTAVVFPGVPENANIPQMLSILCNGHRVAEYSIVDAAEVTAVLPPGIIGDDRLLCIDFRVSTVIRPADLGIGEDTRSIGIGLAFLTLE